MELHPFLHNRVHRGVFTCVAGCRFLRVPQEMKGLGSPATCEAGGKHLSTAYPSLSQIFGKQLFTGFHYVKAVGMGGFVPCGGGPLHFLWKMSFT
jgi:hypothetical protein